MILHKYVTSDRIDTLKYKKIRFTQPAFLDDPFEALPNLKSLFTENEADNITKDASYHQWKETELLKLLTEFDSEIIKYIQNDREWKTILKRIFEHSKEAINNALSTDDKTSNSLYQSYIKEAATKQFGILCLSESNNNIQMWSLYADKHKGFTIGFNSAHPFFNQRKSENDIIYSLHSVKYLIRRRDSTLNVHRRSLA